MGREVRNSVWLWCGIVLPSWQEFCTKVQEDLQDGVCLHKAAFHLCKMIALLYVIRCVVQHMCIAAHEVQQVSHQNIAFRALQILWVLL